MHRNSISGLAGISALLFSLHAAPAFAQTCGPNAMEVKVNQSAQYIIAQCPSSPEATFTILEPGSEQVASISLTRVEGSEGRFRVDGKAPGETTFRIKFTDVVPPQRSGVCNLRVAVVDE